MGFETAHVCLSDHVVPVNNYVDPNYKDRSCLVLKCLDVDSKAIPFTSGAKFGLLNASRSYEETFDTLLPL